MEKRYLSTFLSAVVFPGAGQIYDRHYVRGVSIIVLTSFPLIGLFYTLIKGFVVAMRDAERIYYSIWEFISTGLSYRGDLLLFYLLALIFLWIYAIFDAFVFRGDGR